MTTFRRRQFASVIGVVALSIVLQLPFPIHAQDAQPVFKAGVALVPITALVRDSRNRIVRNLGADDFQVFEGGKPRPIVDFGANDNAPINVAFLLDTSGSMHVASNMARAKDFVEEFVGEIDPTADEVALFTFYKSLRREVSFTNDGDRLYDALDGVKPWGLTSLYDAVAETAKQLGDRASQRRAVVVITDGADTSSALTPAEVSGLASSIDVPVYVVAVVSPLDDTDLNASASTRMPPAAMRPFAARISALASRVSACIVSPSSHDAESASTSSGAPLTMTSRSVALSLCTVAIQLSPLRRGRSS